MRRIGLKLKRMKKEGSTELQSGNLVLLKRSFKGRRVEYKLRYSCSDINELNRPKQIGGGVNVHAMHGLNYIVVII